MPKTNAIDKRSMPFAVLLSTRKHPLDETISIAQELGFDGVEWNLRTDAWQELVPASPVGRSCIKAIHAHNGEYAADTFAAALQQGIAAAEAVGARVVNIHPPALSYGGRENVIKGIQLIQSLAPKHPTLTLVMEILPAPLKAKHKRRRAHDSAEAFATDIHKFSLPATLDTTHVASWQLSPAEFLPHLGNNLCHVHVSDFDPKAALPHQQHLFPGDGMIEWPAFFAALKPLGHQDMLYLTLEPANRFTLKEHKGKLAQSLALIRDRIV